MAAIQTYDLKVRRQAPTVTSCVASTLSQIQYPQGQSNRNERAVPFHGSDRAPAAEEKQVSPMSHAFNEYSLMGTCIRLAQSTFQQAMPAALPIDMPVSADEPRVSVWRRLAETLDDWFYRQQVREREAYLAQAQDIFDLENRLRAYDRGPLL